MLRKYSIPIRNQRIVPSCHGSQVSHIKVRRNQLLSQFVSLTAQGREPVDPSRAAMSDCVMRCGLPPIQAAGDFTSLKAVVITRSRCG